MWVKHNDFLRNYFWYEKKFWADGYFIASIGEIRSVSFQQYIENQGKRIKRFSTDFNLYNMIYYDEV